MKQRCLYLVILFALFCFFFQINSAFALTPAEEKQLFQILGEIKGELKQINKRIDEVNKRIDDTNRRIDEVKTELNKRIDDTNRHIDEVKTELNKRIDDTNRRIDEVNRSLNDRINKLIDIMSAITAVFGGLVVAMMGLVFWDRKTLIEKAVQRVEEKSCLVAALRELAKTDKKLAEVMRSFGLL